MKLLALALIVPALVFTSGCGKKDDHAGHVHAAGEGHAHSHSHDPKMGGQLVELGSHEFNLELLRDSASGKISAWVLDGHAENFVRVTNETVSISVTGEAGKEETVVLKAAANAATGEKLGDSSQFEGQSDVFKTAKPLAVRVGSIQIKSKQYSGISFELKK